MSRVAYVIVARDKAAHVEKAVRAAFAQTYAPMDIVLSDQGSTDGTREILDRLAAAYEGPNTVRRLDCPLVDRRGMPGLNVHFGWVMEQIDAELVIVATADDFSLPERAARMVEAFDRTGAAMVRTRIAYAKPGQEVHSFSRYEREGWVGVRECIEDKVGGSSAGGWRRSFWDQVKPMPLIPGEDVYLPPLACVLGGFWYIAEPLYVYVEHADVNNTGLQGVQAALPEAERLPYTEHAFFQQSCGYHDVLSKMQALQVGTHEERESVARAAWKRFTGWMRARREMTLAGTAPLPVRI